MSEFETGSESEMDQQSDDHNSNLETAVFEEEGQIMEMQVDKGNKSYADSDSSSDEE